MRNINCGVMGHIDSGKTSLCKALHQVSSTAAMDKNPQSQERGITLDLGFSSFTIPCKNPSDTLPIQVTLVDCPGHAGLIRTVISGSRITDMCMLVVDATKGFEPQTAECLVIAEIVTPLLIVVVNKIDMLTDQSSAFLNKLESKIRNTLRKTRFGPDIPIAYTSAISGAGIESLVDCIETLTGLVPPRVSTGPLHIAYDHCFQVKGHGTVFSGTVLRGKVRRGAVVHLPEYGESGEVRSIQTFRSTVDSAMQGDRVGLCVPKLSSEGKERGDIVENTASFIKTSSLVCLIRKTKYFKLPIHKCKFHISIGHTHTLATAVGLKVPSPTGARTLCPLTVGTIQVRHRTLLEEVESGCEEVAVALSDKSKIIELQEKDDLQSISGDALIPIVLVFQKELTVNLDSPIIASRLDLDSDFTGCRIAFFGKALSTTFSDIKEKIVKAVVREGVIERVHGSEGNEYLVRGMIKKDGDVTKYVGKTVIHSPSGQSGIVEGIFGKSGLVRIRFNEPLSGDVRGGKVVMNFHRPTTETILVNLV